MKYLKIDDNKGYFLRENAWVPIDQIIKEDIFELISLAVLPKDGTTFEMDEFSEERAPASRFCLTSACAPNG